MHSCIYEGRVIHRRLRPLKHQFRYGLNMLYLDLDELPQLVGRRGMISDRPAAAASFLPDDHLLMRGAGGANEQTAELIRDHIEQHTYFRPRGPVRLLTQLRYWGYYFSPLNLYYCFDEAGDRVEAVAAEVSNTPWKQQHVYVLWAGNQTDDGALRYAHPKSFHVSPFMDMHMHYHWRLNVPAEGLRVRLRNFEDQRPLFDAALSLRRRPLTRGALTRMMLRYPLMTAQITAAIYYQAFKLWWKSCPYYPHPNKRPLPVSAS